MNDTLVRLAITQSELFSQWPSDAIARLITQAVVLVVEPDTCVHHAGDPAEHVSLLVAGSMNLSRKMPGGRHFTGGLHLAGEFHGLGPVVAQAPHMFTATCKEKTVLVRIPGALIREMIAGNGRLAFSLFAALERRHLRAQMRHASAAVDSTQARIAGLLQSIDARSVHGRTDAEVNLSQDEIAMMLGTRRQVVNRVLREMAEKGAVQVRYGRISITDSDKLRQMALGTD
ncbi:Crp/Fnr family transcriptional regulator [Pantoea sp. 18069]|uniref:Crp/Fnr family transcriptional regulator n=1 Tax=Pantoea sp. 18069 TaxID=2681415 RepID=UPI00135C1A21|nr:Crp/Fnr family transcriptional regulator [Pantoea sp. 18069]